jgi:Arc/MetJ-type ribon-helix-helix transcriptional regulator
MAQLVTRLDDQLVEQIDALIAGGVVASRSEAVRLALTRLIDDHRRRQLGNAIVEGYRSRPQTDDELAGIDDATRSLIEEEPW